VEDGGADPVEPGLVRREMSSILHLLRGRKSQSWSNHVEALRIAGSRDLVEVRLNLIHIA
jgi:hypothetical protein